MAKALGTDRLLERVSSLELRELADEVLAKTLDLLRERDVSYHVTAVSEEVDEEDSDWRFAHVLISVRAKRPSDLAELEALVADKVYGLLTPKKALKVLVELKRSDQVRSSRLSKAR